METAIFYISIAITIVLVSLVWHLYVQRIKTKYAVLKNEYDNLSKGIHKEMMVQTDAKMQELYKTISELQVEMAQSKQESYNDGYYKAKGEFEIKVSPYKNESVKGTDGWFINDIIHQVQIGYQYQLFINGVPVLQPAVVIEEDLIEHKRKMDIQKIDAALNIVQTKLIPMASGSNGLIKLITSKK